MGIRSPFRFFRFEAQEMEASYNEFQRENQRKLVTFYNIIVILISIMMFVSGMLNGISLDFILTRVAVILSTLSAFIFRKNFFIIQKIILMVISCASVLLLISKIQSLWPNNNMYGGFVIGNIMGLVETCFVLSFKDAKYKTLAYILLNGFKAFALGSELSENIGRSIISFLFLMFGLSFYLFDSLLDRKIFKIVYESRDKLKKFQELLSNDLPLSVVIMSSKFDEILYSNRFFQTKFPAINNLGKSQKINAQVFKKFVIEESGAKSQPKSSVFDFVQDLEANVCSNTDDVHVIALSAIFPNEAKEEEIADTHYEITLRKTTWEGNPSYAMVLHNVSDKQMINALKLADEQKDKVIATVSHELRTPINGILGLLEMITKRTSDKAALEYLEYTKSCSKLLLHLVNSILDLSQIRHNSLRINKDWFNTNKFLEELKSLYIFHSQQKEIDFIIQVDPLIPKNIYTDKYRLIEILINLLGNAMKFTFQGSISLKVSIDNNDTQKLLFSVEDTGIGIQEKDKPKLFRMFGKIEQQDKSVNSQGVGLGLTIANELVKALNDGADAQEQKLEFESEYGKGTTFWFRINGYMPLNSPQDSLSQINLNFTQEELDPMNLMEYSPDSLTKFDKKIIEHSTPKYINHKNRLAKFEKIYKKNLQICHKDSLGREGEKPPKCILVVDDSPFNLMAADFIICQLGFSTQKAFNGKQCLDILENDSSKYCLILTYIQMPILGGLEMSKIIIEKVRKGDMQYIPIVAVTAFKLTEKEKQEYREYGIEYTLEKPIIVEKLKSVLNKLALVGSEGFEALEEACFILLKEMGN